MKHLCLVYAPTNKKYFNPEMHISPPLGLIALANYIQERTSDIKISFLDGDLGLTSSDIIDFIEKEKPDIVGQSIQLISDYDQVLEIAKSAHEEAVQELYDQLHAINPLLYFSIVPFALCPFPKTPLMQNLTQSGLLRFDDPVIMGGLWVSCADTKYMSYEEVSDWQIRLGKIGNQACNWQAHLERAAAMIN